MGRPILAVSPSAVHGDCPSDRFPATTPVSMHDRSGRFVAAGLAGLLLAAAFAVPAVADSPHRVQVRKAEPRRVAEYRPNRPFTYDTDLLSESGYAAWMIDELLLPTTPLPRLGAAFTKAERDTGINARYLVAHAILESGWGTSWIARVKHNLFGYGAYDRDPLRYATRFPTFAAGIAAVADQIRAAYLSPDGRWWRGFPTLRGVNRFYASDVHWADKVAVLANAIDQMVVTLRERGLSFGWPRLTTPAPGAPVPAASSAVVEIPWASRTLGLPAAIRFAVRWTPVALAEGGPATLAGAPASKWTPVGRVTHIDHAVRLSVAIPTLPGSWRLEIEARDSDGRPLPATDARPIRPLAVRVAAPTEATLSVGLDVASRVAEAGGASGVAFAAPASPQPQPSGLVATIRNTGRTTIPAIALSGTPTVVEAWSLPLVADESAVQLAGVPLTTDLPPGSGVTFQLPRPTGTAVVVLRLSGDPGVIGRSMPAAVLFDDSVVGGAVLAQVRVPDLRDAGLATPGPVAVPAPVAGPPVPRPPVVASASVMETGVTGDVAIGLVAASTSAPPFLPAEPPAAPPAILLRTMSTLPASPVLPSAALLAWPREVAGELATAMSIPGVPAGIRLVLVALVPVGGIVADPATLRLAWVAVSDPGLDATRL